MRGEGFDNRVLDNPTQLKGRRLEVGRRADLHGEAHLAAWQSLIGHKGGKQIVKKWFQTDGVARTKVPAYARRCTVIAGGDPGDTRIERIKQRGFTFAARLLHADVEWRTHHEAFEFRLHHPVRTAGS